MSDLPTVADKTHWLRLADEIERHGLRKFVETRTGVPALQGKRIVAALRFAAAPNAQSARDVK